MSTSKNNVELIHKTRDYADEFHGVSVWVVFSTFSLLAFSIAISFFISFMPLKIVIAVVIGLLVMRCFILFHDYHHKAILQGAGWAKYLFGLFGLFVFVPSSVWKQSHNFHHAHNAVIETSNIGSFWTVSVEQWSKMNRLNKIRYRIVRHPLTILLGVFTVFIYEHCIGNVVRNPLKNGVAFLALLLHVLVLVLAVEYAFLWDYFFAWLLPIGLAGCLGSYLFYAQHNFPGVKLLNRQKWTYSDAALQSSCFIDMPKFMHWFTGNIAYHHVHHLNHRIPFYRLPEAMNAIEELQSPIKTSLRLSDILACLRATLWDEDKNEMISLADLNKKMSVI